LFDSHFRLLCCCIVCLFCISFIISTISIIPLPRYFVFMLSFFFFFCFTSLLLSFLLYSIELVRYSIKTSSFRFILFLQPQVTIYLSFARSWKPHSCCHLILHKLSLFRLSFFLSFFYFPYSIQARRSCAFIIFDFVHEKLFSDLLLLYIKKIFYTFPLFEVYFYKKFKFMKYLINLLIKGY
jgi:hypothetical protein